MDIDQQGTVIPEDGESKSDGKQIILPGDSLPGVLHVIPQEQRPFFPGQVMPLLMNAHAWRSTLEAVRERKQDVIGLIATRRKFSTSSGSDDSTPSSADLHMMGTVARVHRIHQEGEQLQVLVEGLQRFQVREWMSTTPPLAARVQYFPDRSEARGQDEKAYAVAIINTIKELIPLNPLFGEELKMFLTRSNPNEPALLADFAAAMTTATKDDLQEVLETLPLLARMQKTVELLHREVQIAQAQMEIRQAVESEIQTRQRDVFLREQLKFIQKELGLEKDDKTAELEAFVERIAGRTLTESARKAFDEESKKLAMLEPGSPEFGITRNYLDWLSSMPWDHTTPDNQDLDAADKTLDKSHEGLQDIKDRILEFLALGIMKGDVAGSIICFAGPPGVGKTSLGRSIADALGRRFYRFSVGGMRDEAEIKGHRRTYVGAMPGKLVQALKDTGVANPVIMLDEIDKIGASYQGDPASALLEVLDPEQNANFRDHYLNVDIDLSKVLFVCTANQLDTIPPALIDRMEVIQLSGYLDSEKLAIARKHLLPRQLKRAGLTRKDLKVAAPALKKVVEGYSRESGVRRLEKALASIVRKSVVKLLRGATRPISVGVAEVIELLGQPLYTPERVQKGIGVVTGLAWTAVGGATLPVEATCIHRRQAGLKVTGQLGDVMQESANIAYSFVMANAVSLGVAEDYFAKAFIHIHVPAGATPKDGPSAGITIACALLSLARGRPIKVGMAMTGELTLTGLVYPVGGIREKLVAAKRQGLKKLVLPAANERDFDEIPAHIKKGLTVSFVDTFPEVAARVFNDRSK